LDQKILPTQAAIDKLASQLRALGENGSDLIWGPDVSVIELKGDGCPNIVCGPGIKITREGDNVLVAKVEQ